MFNTKQETETKIAVLEQRLLSYENMLKKIEEAIQVMTETNQNVSKILAVHEERIDYNNKSEKNFLEKIKNLEEKNLDDHGKILQKIDLLEEKIDNEIKNLELKIDDVTRIKWITVGSGIVLAVIIGAISNFFSFENFVTNNTNNTEIHKQLDK